MMLDAAERLGKHLSSCRPGAKGAWSRCTRVRSSVTATALSDAAHVCGGRVTPQRQLGAATPGTAR